VSLLDLGRDLAAVDLPGVRSADDIALGPRYIAARDREQGRLILWDASGGGKLPVPNSEDPWGLAFDDTGLHLATLHQDSRGKGTIRVWALPELKETGSVSFEEKPLFALAPGGVRLAVSGRERPTDRSPWHFYVDIYDVAGGHRVLRIEEDRSLAKMQFGPGGRTLLTVGEADADQARELRVWDTANGKLKTRLRHEDDIDAVRYSAHGDELATQAGGSIWIWNFMSGELLGQITADAGFNDFRLSPDGRYLLTGGRDGAAVVWLWRPDDLRRAACQRLTRNLTADEWTRYLGATPYRATCANLAADGGIGPSRAAANN
jgi:WD40 repeat protein